MRTEVQALLEKRSQVSLTGNSFTCLLAFGKEHLGPKGRVFVGSVPDPKIRWSPENVWSFWTKEARSEVSQFRFSVLFCDNCARIFLVNKH